MTEMASIVARYRGPLLESCVDLEQRFWHALTRTGEWTPGVGEQRAPAHGGARRPAAALAPPRPPRPGHDTPGYH